MTTIEKGGITCDTLHQAIDMVVKCVPTKKTICVPMPGMYGTVYNTVVEVDDFDSELVKRSVVAKRWLRANGYADLAKALTTERHAKALKRGGQR